MKIMNLRKRKSRDQINEKVRSYVSLGNLLGIHDKFTPTKHPGAWCNKGCPKLNNHMQQIKEIRYSTETGHNNSQIQITLHTLRIPFPCYTRQVKIKWIDKKCNQTGEYENPVPLKHYLTTRIKNSLAPWLRLLRKHLRLSKSKCFTEFISTQKSIFSFQC